MTISTIFHYFSGLPGFDEASKPVTISTIFHYFSGTAPRKPDLMPQDRAKIREAREQDYRA
jgi:hypothetical protein